MSEDSNIEPAPLVPPFVRFVASAIPMVFDDSLSYYECLAALTKYMQDVADVVNNNGAVTEEYIQMTKDMKSYMDNYFDNLDVQTEINNKLDEMVADGTLTAIIATYIDPAIEEIEEDVSDFKSTVNGQITIMNNKIDSVTNGNPVPVTSMDDMTDTTKIYVLTTDGYWYYYSGEEWARGGIYQSSVNTDDVTNEINTVGFKIITGYHIGQNGLLYEDANRIITDAIPVKGGETILAKGESNNSQISFCTFYDVNFQPVGLNVNAGAVDNFYTCIAPVNACYVVLSSKTSYQTEIMIDGKTLINHKVIENSRIAQDNKLKINQLISDLTNGQTANMFDKSTALSNYTLNTSTGLAEPTEGARYASDFIPVTPSTTLYAKNGNAEVQLRKWISYDANFSMIADSAQTFVSSYTTAVGAVYIRVEGSTNAIDTTIISTDNSNYTKYGYIPKTDNVLYVAKTGNDDNSGSESSPFLTINKALSLYPAKIIISAGTYTEQINISKDIEIIGVGDVIINPSVSYPFRATGVNIKVTNIKVTNGTTDNFRIVDCHAELNDCEAYEAIQMGFSLNGSTATLNNCISRDNGIDGFNAHDTTNVSYGVFNNCIADGNADDGLSYHEHGNIIVHGGEYINNTKGGITPAGNCTAKIYNAILKGNKQGIHALNSSEPGVADVYSFNNFLANNESGITKSGTYNVTSINDVFYNNTTEVIGSITRLKS